MTALVLLASLLTSGLDDLAWLAGTWSGPTGRATSEEMWLPPAGGAMLGLSRTIAGNRMVSFEYLRLVARPEGVFYIAQPGGRPPVEFKLTRSTATEAVFENPQHDHPKVITYRRNADGSLTATIEGDEKGEHKKQEFRFQPSKK